MIRWRYIANTLREHRALFTFSFFFAGLFQVLILTMVVGADLLEFAEVFYSQLPPPVQALFGEQFMAQFSVSGAVGLGYNHPLVVVLLSIFAIQLPARHIAGEVEAGTLELVFAMPIKRAYIVMSLWVTCALALLCLVGGCWAGTGVALLLFSEARTVPVFTLFVVGLSLWLLMFAISSYTLLISCYASEGGKATLRAAALTLTFYFVNVAVFMWPAVDFLRPFTVFNYHRPQQLLLGQSGFWGNAAVLASLALACGALAIWRIGRRDVPG